MKVVLVSAVALIDVDGRVLLGQRPECKSMAGLWEFPGGKVEPGETPEAALVRELEEELGINTWSSCLAPLTFASHSYDDFHLSGFGVSLKGGINLTLFDRFFVQAEIKTGYINMPDIRTTKSNADTASQEFFFFKRNISFGYIFQLVK